MSTHVCANGDDDTDTFVTTDQRVLGLSRPISLLRVKICVADLHIVNG